MERVKRGEVIEVTERGRPVARLVPVEPISDPLERLVAEGRAIPPTSTGPVPLPPALGDPELDAAAALTAAREEERW